MLLYVYILCIYIYHLLQTNPIYNFDRFLTTYLISLLELPKWPSSQLQICFEALKQNHTVLNKHWYEAGCLHLHLEPMSVARGYSRDNGVYP